MLLDEKQLKYITGSGAKEWISNHKMASACIGVVIGLICIVGIVAIIILKKS